MDKKDITVEKINNATMKELINYSKLFGIERFRDKSDLTHNLLLKVLERSESTICSEWYSQEFMKKKEKTINEDIKRRKVLSQYLDQIDDLYGKIKGLRKRPEPDATGIIQKEDPLMLTLQCNIPNINDTIKQMKKYNESHTECSLVVCGDSGAGKSSFINLLIGQSILPTSIRSNTSCQVKLTYSEEERAEIIDNDSKHHYIAKKDFSTRLRDFLEDLSQRKHVSCKNATIYLHSNVLQGGLNIYDTIGLGENEKFNEEIKKDLKDITGVIFLLKKNKPIGDDTVGGLSQIVNIMLGTGLPGGSMNFIINMIDLLQDDNERNQVKKSVEEQLRKKCFNFMPPEIIPFSTKQELFLQQNKKMSKNYSAIMHHIKMLHLNSICTNSTRVFNFIFQFAEETINSINKLKKLSSFQFEERKQCIKKMKELESDRRMLNEYFKKNNANKLKNDMNRLVREFMSYFKKPETKENIMTTVARNQSRLYNLASVEKIDKEIGNITHEYIINAFGRYNETNEVLNKYCRNLVIEFLKRFAEHELKKEDIYNQVSSYVETVNKVIHSDITNMNLQDILQLPPHQRHLITAISSILLPIAKKQDKPETAFGGWFSFLTEFYNKSNLRSFYNNPDNYVREKASSKYDKFLSKKKNITNMVTLLFEAPRNAIEAFEKLLDDDMVKLKNNIRLLEEDMRNKDDIYETYKNIKQDTKKIYSNLCQFYLLYIQKGNDCLMIDEMHEVDRNASNSSVVCETIPSIGSYAEFEKCEMKPIVANRFCTIYKASTSSSPNLQGTSIKWKMDGIKWSMAYQTYFHFKNISDTCHLKEGIFKQFVHLKQNVVFSFAEQYQQSVEVCPTFFSDDLVSLRQHFEHRKQLLSESEENATEKKFFELQEILRQICNGLKYLHANSLVHYDVTVESFAYCTEKNLVKLTSISKPIKVNIQKDIMDWKKILEIAHFPLSVLESDNHLYTPESDMYGLSTVIYGLWFGSHPFFQEIVGLIKTLPGLIEMLRTTNPITFDNYSDQDSFKEQVIIWTKQCMENKMDSTNFFNELSQRKYLGFTKHL